MKDKAIRYAGISPFTGEQRTVFYGRDSDIEELYELIMLEKQVLLYAKSGVGKSSVMNAGVLPLFEKKGEYLSITIRFRAYNELDVVSPVQRIIDELKKIQAVSLEQPTILDQIAAQNSDSLWFYFKKIQLLGEELKLILVFDQFEELFSYPTELLEDFKIQYAETLAGEVPPRFVDLFGRARSNDRKLMNRQTMAALNKTVQMKSVYLIRSDRMSSLNHLADRIPNIQKSHYELLPLNKEQAREAIVNPAQKDGDFSSPKFEYLPEALEKILFYLTDGNKQPVETTQLQIVCQRIEQNVVSDNISTSISQTDIPDFKNIFFEFYDDAVTQVKTNTHEEVQLFIENQLIIDKRRISLDEMVCHKYVKPQTLRTLVDTRLLRSEPNSTGGYSYELSHDTLVPPIYEVAEDRRQKEEEARVDAERQEELRIAKEKAKSDNLRLTLATAALVVALALTGFALRQTWKAHKSENYANEQLQKIGEITKKLAPRAKNHFYHFKNLADSLFEAEQYLEADLNYLLANYALDKPETIDSDSITKMFEDFNYKKVFTQTLLKLAEEGELLLDSMNYAKAEIKYLEFQELRPTSNYARDMLAVVNPIYNMILIKGGRFVNSKGERERLRTFEIGRYEITNAQFVKFLNDKSVDAKLAENMMYRSDELKIKELAASKWQVEDASKNLPFVYVTRYGANEFCRHYGLNLPTISQWEYAAWGPGSRSISVDEYKLLKRKTFGRNSRNRGFRPVYVP